MLKLVGEINRAATSSKNFLQRAMKQSIAATMRVCAEGIKVKLSGRLGGAEMARSEM